MEDLDRKSLEFVHCIPHDTDSKCVLEKLLIFGSPDYTLVDLENRSL